MYMRVNTRARMHTHTCAVLKLSIKKKHPFLQEELFLNILLLHNYYFGKKDYQICIWMQVLLLGKMNLYRSEFFTLGKDEHETHEHFKIREVHLWIIYNVDHIYFLI